jgi:regulator of protease activity HflC (stomatin/prohibitin superfamily)
MAQEILLGSLGLGIVMLCVFLFFSLDGLKYNQVGLNYSSYFKSIENKTYSSGYHFIGLGHDFIPYDLTISTMEFSNQKGATLPLISCRTKDGLKLDLELSFQYRVISSKIFNIYTTYGNEMKEVLLRVAIDSISDTATKFSSLDFFTKRSLISDLMQKELNERIKKDMNCEVVFFQLRSIDLPDAYENAI